MFVLDEADEMLSRGFKDQIYEIFQKLSTNIQVSVTGDTRVTLRVTGVFYNCLFQSCICLSQNCLRSVCA